MKLTPFAKMFLTVVILGVVGFALYTYRDQLRAIANGKKDGETTSGTKAAARGDAGTVAKPEPAADDKSHFAGVNEAPADPGRAGVTGVAQTTVGAGQLGRPLIVAINTWAGHSPGIVANGGMSTAKGSIYDKLGIKVEFKIFDDPEQKLAAFQAGTVDIMWDTVDSWAREASQLAANNVQAKSIIMQDWSRGGDGIVARKDIQSVEDLKGKKVSVIQFTPSHWFILYMLSQSGLSADDKKSVQLKYFADPPGVKAAFVSGSVDAMVSWEPFNSEAITAGQDKGDHMLVSTAAATNVIADTLVARQETIDKGPATLQAFVWGWFQGIDAMKDDLPAAYVKIGDALKLSTDDVSGMLSGLKLTPFADNAQFYGLTGAKAHYETIFNAAFRVYRSLGVTNKTVDARDWVDTRFVASLAEKYPGQKVVEAPVKPSTKKANPKEHGIINKQVSINFVPNSADIMAGSEFALDALGEMMVSFGNTYLQVEGNTDATGSKAANIVLSQKRADAVKAYLMKNYNLGADRFKTLGLGPDNPVAPNTTEAGRQQNRRTDIKVMLATQ